MERQRVIDAFVDGVATAIHPDDPERAAALKARLPAELPPEPTDEQVDAWVQLAALAADPAVRRCLRAMEQGVDPDSAEGRRIAAEIAVDLPGSRWAELAEQVADARYERYWALLMVLNGQQGYPPVAPLFAWFAAARRAA